MQPPRLVIVRTLWQWQRDSDLAGIRDKAALAKLPAEEQKAFTQLWANVAKAAEPADNAERLTFAQLAHDLKQFAFATRLWTEALASDPTLGDDRQRQHRYNAARAAALAAAGQGQDEPPLDEATKAKLRGQALDWLRTELTNWGKEQPPLGIVPALWQWQQDSGLAGIRDKAALAKLPPAEQQAFTQLWANVARAAEPANDADRLAVARILAERGKRLVLEKQSAEALTDLQKSREIFARLRVEPKWTVLTPVEMKTENGSRLELQKDGSVFVHQPATTDTYSLVFQTELKGIKGLRLEALADGRLPDGGPGWAGSAWDGNFVLSKLSLEAAPAESPDQPRSIALRNAWADFSQPGFNVRYALDGAAGKGWAVGRGMGKDHVAVFDTAEDVGDGQTMRLTVRLSHHFANLKTFLLGRFRLSFTTDAATLQAARTWWDVKDSEVVALSVALAKAHAQQGHINEAAASVAEAYELAKDRAGKARIIAEAMPLDGVLEKLAEHALVQRQPGDSQLQLASARRLAERGKQRLPQEAAGGSAGRLAEVPRDFHAAALHGAARGGEVDGADTGRDEDRERLQA